MSDAHSAFAQLRERLVANGVVADCERVATALLGLAHVNEWMQQPDRIIDWLEQLALELAKPEACKT